YEPLDRRGDRRLVVATRRGGCVFGAPNLLPKARQECLAFGNRFSLLPTHLREQLLKRRPPAQRCQRRLSRPGVRRGTALLPRQAQQSHGLGGVGVAQLLLLRRCPFSTVHQRQELRKLIRHALESPSLPQHLLAVCPQQRRSLGVVAFLDAPPAA